MNLNLLGSTMEVFYKISEISDYFLCIMSSRQKE